MKTSRSNINVKKTASKAYASKSNAQQVIPLGNGWVVKTEGAKTFTVITDNKKEAVSIATSIAKTKRSEIVIYGKDGQIQGTKSYV